MIKEQYRQLATDLGLSGAWLEQVTQKALCNRSIRIQPDYYFLCWSDRSVLWLETSQGGDSRIPPEVYWLYWWKGEARTPSDSLLGAFRAGQQFPHREALLRTVGFHQHEGPFGFMRLVATPWEEK